MSFCECNTTIQNTGVPNKQTLGDVANKLIIVQQFADDGSRNSIPVAQVIDQAYLDARVSDTDASKRWYPLPAGLKNVEDVRADPITESFNDGTTVIVQEGQRTFTGLALELDSVYFGKVESFRCKAIGVFIIDDCGNLHGSVSADGQNLFPFKIEKGTWDPRFIKRTDTTTQRIALNFQYDKTEQDKNIRIIQASETTGDLLNLNGLKDVNASLASATATSAFLILAMDFGTFQNKIPVSGYLTADVTFSAVDSGGSVVPVSNGAISETSTDGTYAVSFDALASGDVLTVSAAVKSPAFEAWTASIAIP